MFFFSNFIVLSVFELFSYVLTSSFLMVLVLLMWRYVSKSCAIMAYFCFIVVLVLVRHNFMVFGLFLIYPVIAGFLFRFCKEFMVNLQIHMPLKIISAYLIVSFILILYFSLNVSAPTISLFLKSGGFSLITRESVSSFFEKGDIALYIFVFEFYLKESVFCLLVVGILICFVISFIFIFIKWLIRRIIHDIKEGEKNKHYFFEGSYNNGEPIGYKRRKKKNEDKEKKELEV